MYLAVGRKRLLIILDVRVVGAVGVLTPIADDQREYTMLDGARGYLHGHLTRGIRVSGGAGRANVERTHTLSNRVLSNAATPRMAARTIAERRPKAIVSQ